MKRFALDKRVRFSDRDAIFHTSSLSFFLILNLDILDVSNIHLIGSHIMNYSAKSPFSIFYNWILDYLCLLLSTKKRTITRWTPMKNVWLMLVESIVEKFDRAKSTSLPPGFLLAGTSPPLTLTELEPLSLLHDVVFQSRKVYVAFLEHESQCFRSNRKSPTDCAPSRVWSQPRTRWGTAYQAAREITFISTLNTRHRSRRSPSNSPNSRSILMSFDVINDNVDVDFL